MYIYCILRGKGKWWGRQQRLSLVTTLAGGGVIAAREEGGGGGETSSKLYTQYIVKLSFSFPSPVSFISLDCVYQTVNRDSEHPGSLQRWIIILCCSESTAVPTVNSPHVMQYWPKP